MWAVELSTIKPQLDAHDVNLVAVGLEDFGVEDFVNGEYFKGDLYIDQNYATYKGLNFDRVSILSLPKQMISKETRALNAKANANNVSGDMKGDGMQLGGTYVIEKGGKVLFHEKQTGFGIHPKLSDLLSSLGISGGVDNGSEPKPPMSCDENACSL